MGDAASGPIRLAFNSQLRVEFRGATVTSDAGLLLPRELDKRLGVDALIEQHLTDPRSGHNRQFPLPDLFRQSIYSRLAGFKTGGRLIRHARYFVLQLGESHLTGTLFQQIIGRIERLAWHPTCERGRCDVLRTGRTAMEHHVVPLAAQEERSTGLSRKSRTKFGIFINLKWRKRSDCPEGMP